jgi:hypothetical protein
MSNVSLRRLSASDLIAVDNVVTLPDPRSGRLGDLFAAAGAPGQSHELTWEFGARTAFNTQSVAWSHGRRRLRRSPAVVAVAAVTSLLVTTTGLAAATGVPAPAARVVDHVLRHINITIQPPGTIAAVAQSPSSSAASPVAVTPGSTGQIRSGNSASCALTSHQTNGGSSCGPPKAHPDRGGRAGTSSAAVSVAVGGRATTSQRSQRQNAGNASSGTQSGGSLGTGRGSNHGTSQGGGTRSGGTGGQSTGTGTGTGSNRGGNKGTGSNRGGNKGTGRGGRHGTGTKRGTGTGGKNGTGAGNGNGSGTGVGTGPSHHHHGTGAMGATSPSQPSAGLPRNP